MKTISIIEAAVLYDFANRVSSFPSRFLVFDLDHSTVGLCACTEKGKTRLIKEDAISDRPDLWEDGIARICEKLGLKGGETLSAGIENHLQEINQKTWNYNLSERTRNNTLFSTEEINVNCEDMEAGFSAQNKVLQELLEKGKKLAEDEDLFQLRFILVGKAARLWPLEYAFRETFSEDPLLSDDRFANAGYRDSPDRVPQLGMEFSTSQNFVGHTVRLLSIDREGWERQSDILVSEEQDKADIETPTFLGPLFVSENEPIELEIDGNRNKIFIPDSIELSKDHLIDLAVGYAEDQLCMLIRRSSEPAQHCSINIC